VVLADESRINQMLSTLINNAVNYTQQGYVQFGYHLLQTNKRVIEFFVKDTGSGIPESKRDIIFKRYGRMDGSRMVRPGATSLGLSIVKDLVRLMGGELQVESVEGKGSAFYMQIPYEDSSTFFQKSENLELSPNAQIRILVAEDDMNTFRLIQEAIRQSSFVSTIDYASNGLEAIEKMREQQYDLLLLDLKMPLMDGMQAASYIRQKFPKPKNSIPIVAVSASVNSDTRQACIEIGISGFIQKPFSNHQIVEAINLALNA
jgi:CheY-like chemotaxis protein